MQQFFKTIVMNYLLKNGDAHLKNFGLLFNDDFTNIKFAPAYDIVTTTPYIADDTPALTLAGRKIWHKKDALINFGRTHCLLSQKDAQSFYQECLNALKDSIEELKNYIEETPHFKIVGSQMLEAWQSSTNNN
jgi:serine/threonine-protein kinase HipA